ncbi:MAG: family 16 glycosylhydrolase, partial [Planctomycetes bacterium]|nr:family 16 glycosylhydrolase [Planctomycetota bacterium]
DLAIGANPAAGTSYYFRGAIDDVSIYDYALTDQEVATIFNPLIAVNPDPANKAVGVGLHPRLSWEYTTGVTGYDVYLGTDTTAVDNATTASTGIYQGYTDTNSIILAGSFEDETIYYWRVDSIADAEVLKGTIWEFTTYKGGDFDGDGAIGYRDLSIIAENWLDSCSGSSWCNGADINTDNIVNMKDYALLAGNWVADPNLVGWWKMDGPTPGEDVRLVKDYSGRGNDGTMGSSDVWMPGGGLDFDGGSWGASGIVFPSDGADLVADMALTGAVTVSYVATWANGEYTRTNYPYDGRDATERMITMECTDSNHIRNFFGPDPANKYSWGSFDDTSEGFIFGKVGKTWGDYIRITTTANLTTGDYVLYIDDVLYASGSGYSGSFAGLATFTIGRTLWAEMEGKMKDFRIYNKALSAEEVAELLVTEYAHSPVPGDNADWPYYSTSDATLRWGAGITADSHDVYFGTDYNDVADANHQSDEFMANVAVTYYYVDGMSADSTYYWRVDEVDRDGIWKGDVWSFHIDNSWGKEGWVLTFHDEFDGNDIDTTKWNIGSWSGWSGITYFPSDDPDTHTVSNGTLKLHNVIKDYYDPGTETTKHYGSGKLQSDDKLDQAFGYFECSAKLPVGDSSFPAFWLMPSLSGGTWWPNAEIDIMEHTYNIPLAEVGANIHWNDYGDDHVSWASIFAGDDTEYHFNPSDTAFDDFHVYAMKWEPGVMYFYVDEYNYATFRDEDVPNSMSSAQPASYDPSNIKVPTNPGYIILNNSLAAWIDISEEGATSTFEIDYVRIYTSAYEAPAVTVLTYDDFESDFGNYTDGGDDCSRYTGGSRAYKDSCAINIQDDSGVASSFYHTSGIDVRSYDRIKIAFAFYAYSMSTGHDFWVEYFDGNDWNTVATYVAGTDFSNDNFYTKTIIIDSDSYDFPIDMKIRFQCSAGSNYDDVYIDSIAVTGEIAR